MSAQSSGRSGSRRVAVAIMLGVISAAAAFPAIGHGREPVGARARADAARGSAEPTIALEQAPAAPATSAPRSGERDVMLAAANRLQQVHRFDAAEALLSDWLRRSPADARVLLVRSQLRIHAGNPRGALADCMAAAAGLDALAASGCAAQARARLGDARGARRLVEAALARSVGGGAADTATESWASGIAAELAARDGEDAAADRWHRRAVALGGDAHYPPLAYADFLLARGRRVEALQVLAHAPDTAEVRRRRARAGNGS